MSNYNPYNGGRAAFARGKPQKPTNDKNFMEHYGSLVPKEGSLAGMGNAIRAAKQEAMTEWKSGWLDAQAEAEKPVAKKKAKKKVTKKKTSKKKVSKKTSKK